MIKKTNRLLIAALAITAWPALAADKPNFEKLDLSKLPPASDRAGVSFSKDIQPLLQDSCVRCHGAERPKGGLRLDSREALLKGGEDGKMVVPGESKKSWVVIAASRIDDDTAMPPKRKPGGPRGDGHGPGAGPGRPPISGAGDPGGPPPGGFGGPGARGFGPPPKPLTAEQVGLLRAWVDQGAKE